MKKILSFIISLLIAVSANAQQSSCPNSKGEYSYYVELIIEHVHNDFNKEDFINHISSHENISSIELTLLKNSIQLVEKSFPSSKTPVLQKIVSIMSSVELSSYFYKYTKSIEYHECRPEAILLSIENVETNTNNGIELYPNPITDDSKIYFKSRNFDYIQLINSLGQIVQSESVNMLDEFSLLKLRMSSGLYILRIHNKSDNSFKIIRVIR